MDMKEKLFCLPQNETQRNNVPLTTLDMNLMGHNH
jgi:hypothetical protein